MVDIVAEMWYNTRSKWAILMPGPGRPPVRPIITHVRELTEADLNGFRQGRLPPIKRYRDSHHQMARLFAMGLRVSEVAAEMGYSISRVSVHYNNPVFRELVAGYSKVNDELTRDAISNYNALILSNGMKAERKIADKLDDDENDELSIRELLSITRDAADRVGLSKRSIQTNISVDFASMLDRALDRTRAAKSGDLKLAKPDTVIDLDAARPTVPPKGGTFFRRA